MKTLKNICITLAVFVLIIAGIVTLELSQDASYPEFKTNFSVGTQDFVWTDSSRNDSNTGEPRSLLVKVWYPSDINGAVFEGFHPNPDKFSADVSAQYGIPEFIINRLAKSSTKSVANAPISTVLDKYPVLIFSHGMNGSRVQNTSQMEYLAGNGYVVFGIDHVGTSSGTVFPDGTTQGYYEYNGMIRDSFSDTLVVTWSKDQLFVLDMIDSLTTDSASDLFKKLKVSKIGLFGHSYGGHTTAYTLSKSDRFVAGINMDGYYFGTTEKTPFEQPFLEIRAPWPGSDTWSDEDLKGMGVTKEYMEAIPKNWDQRLKTLAKNGAIRVTFPGANHMTFSDFLRVVPFRGFLIPEYDKQYVYTMELVKNWFDHTMNGGHSENFEIPSNNELNASVQRM